MEQHVEPGSPTSPTLPVDGSCQEDLHASIMRDEAAALGPALSEPRAKRRSFWDEISFKAK